MARLEQAKEERVLVGEAAATGERDERKPEKKRGAARTPRRGRDL
ncbi:MAG: hypothetical protein AW07_00069 [Candidatus Accumulibacter sp. SK-11]|nr:MAG: hypothetical protein AW07_00069 [Candidatus Accumulibacter sp. SK-11]